MRSTKTNHLFILVILSCLDTAGQAISSDSVAASQFKAATAVYHQALYPENGLYNGIEYLPYTVNFVENQPFFLSNKPLDGSITYKGIRYDNVKLMYDLTRQQLVIIHPLKFQRIRLGATDINAFSIADHRFLRLQADSNTRKVVAAGLYEILHEAVTVSLFKSHKKTVTEELNSTEGVLYFIRESSQYYVKKDGNYHLVTNKKSVLNIFNDRRKEMTQFLKKQKFPKRASNEAAYISAVKYYEKLTTNR